MLTSNKSPISTRGPRESPKVSTAVLCLQNGRRQVALGTSGPPYRHELSPWAQGAPEGVYGRSALAEWP